MTIRLPLLIAALLAASTALGQPPAKRSTKLAATDSQAPVQRGGLDAGGQGLIRVGDKLLTPAEAGIQIFKRSSEMIAAAQVSPDFYFLKPETKKAVRDVLSSLPLDGIEWTYEQIISAPDRSTFQKQDQIDPKTYAAIKADYKNVIASFKQRLDESAFELAAYSEGDKTFILPTFDELAKKNADGTLVDEMGYKRQALVLIHEYHMREFKDLKPMDRLTRTLEIDSVIYRYLNSKRSDELDLVFHQRMSELKARNFSSWSIERAMVNRTFGHILTALEKTLGRPVLASEIILKPGQLRAGYPEAVLHSLVKLLDTSAALRLNGTLLSIVSMWQYSFAHDKDPYANYAEIFEFGLYSSSTFGQVVLPSHEGNNYGEWKKKAVTLAKEVTIRFNQFCAEGGGAAKAKSEFGSTDFVLYFDAPTGTNWVLDCHQSAQGWNGYGQLLEIGSSPFMTYVNGEPQL